MIAYYVNNQVLLQGHSKWIVSNHSTVLQFELLWPWAIFQVILGINAHYLIKFSFTCVTVRVPRIPPIFIVARSDSLQVLREWSRTRFLVELSEASQEPDFLSLMIQTTAIMQLAKSSNVWGSGRGEGSLGALFGWRILGWSFKLQIASAFVGSWPTCAIVMMFSSEVLKISWRFLSFSSCDMPLIQNFCR